MSVRVYVGGLPVDAKNQELRERFGRFVGNATACQLTDVELPKPKKGGSSGTGISRGFAYLTLEGADAATESERLQKTFNRTKWRGSVLKVQQQFINTPVEELQPLKAAVKFKGRRKTEFPEEEVEMKQETDTETSEEEQEKMEEVVGEDDIEDFVRQMEQENEMVDENKEKEDQEKEKKVLTKEEMNARRLAALEAKQQRKKEEKVVIPAIGESVANKKITFDDSGNEQEPEEQEVAGVISNWMDSSDDEAEGDDERGMRSTFDFTGGDDVEAAGDADAEAQAAFALRPEFVGEKGKKLFEMQKRFGGDSRFRLDARFLEEEANEYGGNDVDDEGDKEVDEDAVTELQNFLEEANPEEAARHAREMREEEEAALRVVSMLFPDVDVTRLQRRMQEQRAPKDPLKEAAWMGELKRYDPRDAHACREFEIPMATVSSGVQKDEEVVAPKREEKEIPTGGDRFFSTTGDLSNLFTRVRKNSEDGEEGEAALDGVFGFGAGATETDSAAPFKLSSLFSFPVGEDKPLAALGEQLLEDDQDQQQPTPGAPDWTFSQGFNHADDHDDEAMATDSEAGDDADEEDKTDLTKTRIKKSLEDFLAFGRTFVGGEEVEDWPERRKKLTLDYKRKRRDAVKMKKRQNKQQNKANKAKTEAGTSSKWKKARL
ncbi:hypothetical protein PHMEG_0003326 [Phytophthora megakarya]|uniref:RRM domain-containing protein n=1 Tax=Phytophthora megakarya TaxID=4795 RepID=A0A225WWG2_9STRA|nr:hypothetical protein PHMEG_0003326 [Phytophthora megakarya]